MILPAPLEMTEKACLYTMGCSSPHQTETMTGTGATAPRAVPLPGGTKTVITYTLTAFGGAVAIMR